MSNEIISGMLTVTEQDGGFTATLETSGGKELHGGWHTVDGAMEDLGDSIKHYLIMLDEADK